MNASPHLPHRQGRPSTPAASAKPTAKPAAKVAAKPRSARRRPPAPAPSRVLLARWATVFPLSGGPAERVRRHPAAGSGDDLAHVVADYLREIAEQVPAPCTVDGDGNLLGPADFARDAGDVLFRAVFTTDLDAVLERHRRTEPVPAASAVGE